MPRSFKNDEDGDKGELTVPSQWTESRCHVCTSEYRKLIDKMIAMGVSYAEISRTVGGVIERRSIANHAKQHLNYQEAVIRRIIERETELAQEDIEEGVAGLTKRKAYLEAIIHKGMEQLLSDKLLVTPRDAVLAAEALDNYDKQTESLQLEIIKEQFNAFLVAIREIAELRGDPNLGSDIFARSKEILGVLTQDAPQLNP